MTSGAWAEPVEFVGGPVDGEVRVVPTGQPVFIVRQPLRQVGVVPAAGLEMTVPWREHVYYRDGASFAYGGER